MAGVVFVMLILAMTGYSSATWCICKDGMGDAALQKTLDYACGAGADCTPIHQNGVCYLPNTVKAHCSYAVNSFFQKKGQAQGTCDFAGTAQVTTADPGTAGTCVYPSSQSTVGTGTTPISTTPTTTTPATTVTPSTTTPTTTTTTTPYTTTPSTGVLGGIGSGVGPSGAGINTDISDGGFMLQNSSLFSFLISLLFSGLMFFRG